MYLLDVRFLPFFHYLAPASGLTLTQDLQWPKKAVLFQAPVPFLTSSSPAGTVPSLLLTHTNSSLDLCKIIQVLTYIFLGEESIDLY